jgi:hypothetical protein
MFVLEGQIFDSLKAAQKAAEKLSRVPREKGFRREEGVSRWGYPPEDLAEAS